MQCLIPSYKQEQEDKKGSSFMAFAPKIVATWQYHLYSDNDSLNDNNYDETSDMSA